MHKLKWKLNPLRHEKSESERLKFFSTITYEMNQVGATFATARDAINNNANLSETGKKADIAKLAESFRPRFNSLTERLGNIKRQFAVELSVHTPPTYKGTGNAVLDHLERREVMDHISRLTLSQKAALLLNPENDPSGRILFAVQNDPFPDAQVASVILPRAVQARADAFSPEGADILEDQKYVLESLNYNLSVLTKSVEIQEEETAGDGEEAA